MIFKNSSKSKLTLAFISIVITFFVWQQGLRDSLNRPSVSFDISQKEQEIAELSVQSIPVNLKKFFIINDPVDQINKSLSEVSFEELTERNKLIRIISSESNDPIIYKNISKDFENKNFKFLIDEIEKKSNNNFYKPNLDKFDLYKSDKFLYHILNTEAFSILCGSIDLHYRLHRLPVAFLLPYCITILYILRKLGEPRLQKR